MKFRNSSFTMLAMLLTMGCSDDTIEASLDARAQQLCFEQFSAPTDWELSDGYWVKTLPAHRDGCFLAQATLQVGPTSMISGSVCNICDRPLEVSLVGLSESIPLGVRYDPPGEETQLTCLDSPMPTEGQAVPFAKELPPGDFFAAYSLMFQTNGMRNSNELEILWPDFTARPPTYEGAVNGHSCLKRGRLDPIDPSDFSIQVVAQEPEP